MTASATAIKQTVADWVKVFPRQVTQCYTSSVTFMKQLTTVAISTITYLKNALPHDSYMVETFAGTKIRILKKKCRDHAAQFLATALTQAFEAFDKKYLHQLALCFYEDECKIENLVEYHIFEYSYNDDGVTMNIHSKNRNNITHNMDFSFETIREKTINLVRAYVVLAQNYPNQLPASCDISIRLYYNEDAPADYQAPGYHNAAEDDHLVNALQQSIKVGWVQTPFHKLAARCHVKEHIGGSSHEAIPSQNVPILSDEMDLSEPFANSLSEDGSRVVCPCNKTDFEQNGMLTCQYCNTQQHAACFGKLRVTPDMQHCCTACYDDDRARKPTDYKLASLEGWKREYFSILRRALHFCSQMPLLCVKDFMQKFCMTKSTAFKVIKILYSVGILKINPQLDPTPQKVIIEKLKEVQVSYFHTKEDNIVDRLIAETFSQESLNDVLSPIERASLNSNGGNTERNDRVLKEYSDNLTEDTTETNARALKERSDNLRGGNIDVLTDLNYLTLQEYRAALPADNISEPDAAPAGSRRAKRKIDCENNKPSVRQGVRSKRVRGLYD